jgi:hypothetical protein
MTSDTPPPGPHGHDSEEIPLDIISPNNPSHDDAEQPVLDGTQGRSESDARPEPSPQDENVARPGFLGQVLKFTRRFSRPVWTFEILAALLSLGFLSAIFGILHYGNNKRLSEWKLYISPNALVSFIGTLARACMLFIAATVISQMKWLYFKRNRPLSDFDLLDSASRGPLGSLMVLCSQVFRLIKPPNGRTPGDSQIAPFTQIIIAVAAWITLLSLILGPSIQLAITTPLASYVATQPASYQLATTYNPTGDLDDADQGSCHLYGCSAFYKLNTDRFQSF